MHPAPLQDPTKKTPTDRSDIVAILVGPYRSPRWFRMLGAADEIAHRVSRIGEIACTSTRMPRSALAHGVAIAKCPTCEGMGGNRELGAEYEDPAPPWAAMLADAYVRLLVGLDDMERWIGIGEAAGVMAWCASGEPRSRAAGVLTILATWRGPHRLAAATQYVAETKAAKAGRRRGSPKMPARVYVPSDWDEHDAWAKAPLYGRSAFGVARRVIVQIQARADVTLGGNGKAVEEIIAQALAQFAAVNP